MTQSRPGPRLEMRQAQQLAMTQQLQQSIKLLQLSSLELREYIEQEMEKNPLLTQEENEPSPVAGETPAEVPVAELAAPVAVDRADVGDVQDDYSAADDAAGSWDAPMDGGRYSGGGVSDGEDGPDINDAPQQEKSLRQHLSEQVQLQITDPAQRMIAMYLVDLVDDAGYIKEDLAIAAEQLGAEPAMIAEALHVLQGFDPSGVCARNLSECLAIQLRERDRFDPAMQGLVEHLDMLASGQMEPLRKLCGVDMDDLRQMVIEIRSLNPKPGHGFGYEPVQAVEPDVYLRRLPDGNWHIELNSQALPRVLVNRRYYARLSRSTRSGDERKYLSEQLGVASWLVKALDQRANTILKVTTEIVAQQDAFFRLGVRYMKPMTLKDIAVATGFHESTVSRVTTHKYLMSQRGLYELKYFFSSGVQHSAGGEDVSSEAVKHLIRELIEKETVEAVFSDDDLAEKLKEKNISVARRTVAKYREALGIASSVQRRRQKISGL